MYVSKYYTCEEIDQRLLQGYYDDFVKAGFVGSKDEFFQFVLSISNKVDKEEGKGLSTNDFTNELKEKLDQFKSVTKLSELENDVNYQTYDDVKAAIDKLVGDAPEVLDTLKELADALADDPNFAANITNKITEILNKLNDEIARAKEAEATLGSQLENFNNSIDTDLKALKEKLDSVKELFDSKLESLKDKLDDQAKDLNDFKLQEAQDISQVREYCHGQIDRESERAQAAEQELGNSLNELSNKHTTEVSQLQQQLTQETSERKQNDQSLSDKLDNEISDRKAADQSLKEGLDSEVQARKDAIKSLEDTLNSDLSANQTELSSKIEKEIQERKSADVEINASISTEKAERKAADDVMSHRIDDLENNISGTEDKLNEKLEQEVQARKEADANLDNAKVDKVPGYGLSKNDFDDELKRKLDNIQEKANYIERLSELINDAGYQTKEQVSEAIEAVIDSAPEVLNTLREIAQALGDDPNFAATITNKITVLASQLNSEIESRKDKDSEFSSLLANEVQSRKDADDTIKSLIQSEKEARTEQLNNLKENLESHKASQESINQATSKAIEDLQEASGAELTEIRGLIATNVAGIQRNLELIQNILNRFGNVESFVTDKINEERARREESEADILRQLEEAVEDYTNQIKELSDNLNKALDEEKNERTAQDNALSERINTNKNTIDKEVSDRTAADTTLQGNIDSEAQTREQADTNLTNRISQEEQTRQSEDEKLSGKIDTEVSERKAADSKEESERKAEDERINSRIDTLESNLSKETSDRESADNTLQTNINNEAQSRQTADTNLQNQIDTQVTNLNKEAQTRAEKDTELSNAIDTKQDKFTTGTGLALEDGVLKVTIDHTIYKVVDELPSAPASGDENKIHLVPSTNTETNNSYIEYIWKGDGWEKLGQFKPEVDLTPYQKIANLTGSVTANSISLSKDGGVNKLVEIEFSDDLPGSVSGSKLSLSLKNILSAAVGSGMYKISVDTKGRVTGTAAIALDDLVSLGVAKASDVESLTARIAQEESNRASQDSELSGRILALESSVVTMTDEEVQNMYNEVFMGTIV